jgi:hypothetical protein
LIGLLLSVGAAACASEPPPEAAPVRLDSPEDQVLRIGRVWQALEEAKGFHTPPNPISVYDVKSAATLRIVAGQKVAREEIELRESFQMRAGGNFQCSARAVLESRLKWALHGGEPAVEITRPAARIARRCRPSGFSEPELDLPGGSARFVLRGDQLVAFAPALVKRVYLPIE